jgi:NADH:ubiquinone oxidoreductase subunit 6 (subunit J)
MFSVFVLFKIIMSKEISIWETKSMTSLKWKKTLGVSLGVLALLVSSVGLMGCEQQGGTPNQEQPAEPGGTN